MQREIVYGQPSAGTAATGAALVAGFVRRWVITLLPCSGLIFLVRRRPTDPTGWIGLGLVIGGVAAALAFWHPSYSQLYFPILALPIAYALSGAGVGLFLAGRANGEKGASSAGERAAPVPGDSPRRKARLSRIVAIVAIVTLAALVQPLTRLLVPSGGARPRNLREGVGLEQAWTWIAPPVAVLAALLILATLARRVLPRARRRVAGSWAALVALLAFAAWTPALLGALAIGADPGTPTTRSASDPAHPPAVTPALFQAGQYLRRHADPNDVVATNRVWNGVHGKAGKDNRDFSVSALSGLRTVVGGYGYAPRLLEGLAPGRSYILLPFWDQARLDDELALIEAPTAQRVADAYRSGTRWILADERSGPVSPDLARLTEVVTHDDGVWLARLRVPPS
jgi:hypothetical protein